MFEDGYNDTLRAQLNANVTRFAAYKAYHATQQIKQAKTDGSEPEPVLHKYNRWQATEYATTVARCRTARQFADFNSRADLFPCLRWLPSRSASPREEHRMFWNRVWRKDDPFWQTNQPGNLWNCKCDWEETDDEPTDGNPANTIAAQGLEGNPAITGEVFSPDASYFETAHETGDKAVKNFVRDYRREHWQEYSYGVTTDIGHISVDNITVDEVSKGAADNSSLFLKFEVMRNIGEYIRCLTPLPDQEVELGHNNRSGKYFRRKTQFVRFRVFLLHLNDRDFIVKFGEYRRDGSLHLYTITG